MVVIPLQDYLAGPAKRIVWILFAAVSFVLLICCSNVANLILNQNVSRQRELAIRTAIGAEKRHLLMKAIIEGLTLALLGGLLGLLLAEWGLDAILATVPFDIPMKNGLQIDFSVVLFALCVSIITGLFFCVMPDPLAALRYE